MTLLALEPLLKTHLAQQLGSDVVGVFTADDLNGVRNRSQLSPSVQIYYESTNVTKQSQGLIYATQEWHTVAVVRNAQQAGSNEQVRVNADTLLDSIIAALHHWQPDSYQPFELVGAGRPAYSPAVGYFPLTWRTARQIRSSQLCASS